MSLSFVSVRPTYAYVEKKELLEALYGFLDEEAKRFGFVCAPGCFSCCTTQLWVTSLETLYLLEAIDPDLEAKWLSLKNYPRPKSTPNTMALLLMRGEEVPEEEVGEPGVCPVLKDGLCPVYERRPLCCRVMFSQKRCDLVGQAVVPEEFLALSSLLFQLVEEVDVGGVYGHITDQVRFLRELERGAEEVPEYLLGNREAPQFAMDPQEDWLREALARLYRRRLPSGRSFKQVLDEVKEGFGQREVLSFLNEIL